MTHLSIVQVCPYPLTAVGGVQTQALGLADEFRARGHAVTNIAPSSSGSGLRIRFNGTWFYPMQCLRGLTTMRSTRRRPVDLLIVHEPLNPFSLGASARFGTNAAVVVAAVHAANSRWYTGIARAAWGRVRNRFAYVVASSETAARSAQDYGARVERVIRVALPTPQDHRQPVISPRDAEGRTRILFIGRHDPRKGLERLLKAACHLPDYEFLIAGHGPLTRRLKRRYRHTNIRWLGAISDEERWELLRTSHAFCAPAVGLESFGLVLLEAMEAGIPIVASDIPGYREALGAPAAGILVDSKDGRALAEALRAASSDGELRTNIIRQGFLTAASFTMKDSATAYLRLAASPQPTE